MSYEKTRNKNTAKQQKQSPTTTITTTKTANNTKRLALCYKSKAHCHRPRIKLYSSASFVLMQSSGLLTSIPNERLLMKELAFDPPAWIICFLGFVVCLVENEISSVVSRLTNEFWNDLSRLAFWFLSFRDFLVEYAFLRRACLPLSPRPLVQQHQSLMRCEFWKHAFGGSLKLATNSSNILCNKPKYH